MIRPAKKMCAFVLAVSLAWTTVNVPVSASAEQVTNSEKWQTTDRVATFIEPIYDDQCLSVGNNIAFIEKGAWGGETSKDTKIVFIDKDGNKTVLSNINENGDKMFDSVYPAISDLWYASVDTLKLVRDDKVAFVDFKGTFIGDKPKFYKHAQPITNNVLLASDDGVTYKIINKNGEVTVDGIKNLELYYNQWTSEYRLIRMCLGFCIVCSDKSYFIDQEGNLLFEVEGKIEIENAGSCDVIKEANSDKKNLIDDKGNVVLELQEDVFDIYVNYRYSNYVRYGITVEENGVNLDKYIITDIITGEIVSDTYSKPIFDGEIIIGEVNKGIKSVYDIQGTVFIEDLDRYIYELAGKDGYELYDGWKYDVGILIIPLRKLKNECGYEFVTYVCSANSGFATIKAIRLDGYWANPYNYDEYVITEDKDGYLNSIYIKEGEIAKEFTEKKYKEEWVSNKPECLFWVSVYEEEELKGYANVLTTGVVGEVFEEHEYSENTLYDFMYDSDGVCSVVNEEGKIIYTGQGECIPYNKDCFIVQDNSGYYIYDNKGDLVFNGIDIVGDYWFCDAKYYGQMEILSTYDGENIKYGAIRLGENISIKNAEIKLSCTKCTYTGKAITPSVESVMVDEVMLIEGKHYTVAYKNNTKVGKATVTVIGKGDYKGTCSTTFDIEYGTGMYKGADGQWYYYTNGKVNTSYVGFAKNSYGWWYMNKGKLDTSYTGLVKHKSNWVYVSKGKLDTKYTGLVKYKSNWVYVNKGKLDTKYTGLVKYKSSWLYVNKGKLDSTFTGMAKNKYGWWYVKKGKLDMSYTGISNNKHGCWYMKDGRIDFTYTGLAKNAYGTWYIQKGYLDMTYTGNITINGTTYKIKNGKVK